MRRSPVLSDDAGTILVSGLSDGAYGFAIATLAAIGIIGLVATLFLPAQPAPSTADGALGKDIAAT